MEFEISIHQDVWMDNGIENFYRMLNSIQRQEKGILRTDLSSDRLWVEIFDPKRFKELLEDAIKTSRDNYIFYWDEDKKTKIKVNKKKAFVTIHYAKARVTGRNILQEAIFRDEKISRILEKFLEELESNKKNKACVLCGTRYGVSIKPAYLKQAVYPFATKIKSLSGVRTKVSSNKAVSGMIEYYKHLCSFCYLIGTLEWADPAIIYRCFIGGRKPKERFSVVLLPFESNLIRLKEVKDVYRSRLQAQERVSNVRVLVKRKGGEQEEAPIGKFTTILGFLEKFLRDYAAQRQKLDFLDYRIKISRDWIAMEIPEKPPVDIKAHQLIVEDDFLKLLGTLIENNRYPYSDFIGPLWLKDAEGRGADQALQNETKEELARSLFGDDFGSFAAGFVPRKRTSLVVYPTGEATLEEIIKEWRWYKMGLKEEELDVVKKAARVVARVGGSNLSILYKIERARNLTELLNALTQVSHKIIGMEVEKRRYLSVDSVEKVVGMLHSTEDNPKAFNDLRSTLVIFASMEWAKETFRGGEGNA